MNVYHNHLSLVVDYQKDVGDQIRIAVVEDRPVLGIYLKRSTACPVQARVGVCRCETVV